MTSKQFVVWLEGFISAANDYNITPKHWQNIKDMMNKVTDQYDDPHESNNSTYFNGLDHNEWTSTTTLTSNREKTNKTILHD